MPQENLFELNIPAADLQAVQGAIQTLTMVLAPHLISLSNETRRELPKMGDKSLAFVRKAREYATNNPELVPAFLNLQMFEADLRGVDTLNNLLRTLQPLVFYRNVKAAALAGQPNAKTIADDLSMRFPTGSRVKAVPA